MTHTSFINRAQMPLHELMHNDTEGNAEEVVNRMEESINSLIS